MICWMTTFGEWLKEYAEVRGIKPTEIAKRTHVNAGAISRIMSGERIPTADTLVKIADGLGIPYEDILRAVSGKPVINITNKDDEKKLIDWLVFRLSPEGRKSAITYLEYLAAQEAKK